MTKYEKEESNIIEDLQGVDLDINFLAKKYIDPIDAIRSSTITQRINFEKGKGSDKKITIAQAILNETLGLQIDFNNPIESRIHAFYRLIGLPVMSENGFFYNPGFNPNELTNNINHISVINGIPQLTTLLQRNREDDVIQRNRIFALQGTDSTSYTLALQYPKKFKLIDNDTDPFDYDLQRFVVDDRIQALSKIITPSGTKLTNFFFSGSHILKPFMVDPIIEATVMPGKNKVCVPFLKDKNSTRLERDIFLQRPILEFICVNRLIQPEQQQFLIENLFGFTSNDPDVTVTSQDLNVVVQAFLGESATFNVNNLIFATGGPSMVSISNISSLIKQIKAAVKLLADSMRILDVISTNINLFPITDEKGPEFGINLGKIVKADNNTKLETRILNLQVNKEISEASTDSTNKDKGIYAGSYTQNIQKNFKDELDFALEQRNHYGSIASKAYRTIELVTGEISGLGLIDILAIYCAIWGIDVEALIALLDEDAFARMVEFNPELITPEVQARKSGQSKVSGKEALTKLEQKINSILFFADNLLVQYLQSPGTYELGSQG